MSSRVLSGLVIALAAGLLGFGGFAGSSRAAATGPSVDIELAFDTTGSMALSLDRARQDAQQILAGVHAVVPTARFSVVSFRDPGNPGGEYQTLQPFTADTAAVQRALGRLKAVGNPAPTNLTVESYNLAFHRSFTDRTLGWAAQSRKIVVVMGDAEGYGGASAGLPGCKDTHPDPDGFDMRAQLAGMRAAQRTLVMVREISPLTSTSLDCYAALAALTYTGGAARDGAASDLVTPLVSLVRGAVAPIIISPALPLVLPGGKASFTIKLSNPNAFPLKVADLTVAAPVDFSALTSTPAATKTGTTLTWTLGTMIAPGTSLSFRVSATAGSKPRVARITAKGNFQLATGSGSFASDARSELHISHIIRVKATAATRPVRFAGSALLDLTGRATAAATSGTNISGSFHVGDRKHRITLQPTSFRLALKKGHAVATLQVRVTSQHGAPACHTNTVGTLTVSDRSFAAPSGTTSIRLALPSTCQTTTHQWTAGAATIQPLP